MKSDWKLVLVFCGLFLLLLLILFCITKCKIQEEITNEWVLAEAVQSLNFNLVRQLIQANPFICSSWHSKTGETLLCLCIKYNWHWFPNKLLYMCKLLIEEGGVDLNESLWPSKYTPLHLACTYELNALAVYLLEDSAVMPAIQSADKTTPLHIACSKGNSFLVRLLLEKTGTYLLKYKDKREKNCFYYALKSENKKLIQYLIMKHKCRYERSMIKSLKGLSKETKTFICKFIQDREGTDRQGALQTFFKSNKNIIFPQVQINLVLQYMCINTWAEVENILSPTRD